MYFVLEKKKSVNFSLFYLVSWKSFPNSQILACFCISMFAFSNNELLDLKTFYFMFFFFFQIRTVHSPGGLKAVVLLQPPGCWD